VANIHMDLATKHGKTRDPSPETFSSKIRVATTSSVAVAVAANDSIKHAPGWMEAWSGRTHLVPPVAVAVVVVVVATP
jgi:hypothetical protein